LQFTAFNGMTAPLTVGVAGTLTLASGNIVTVTVSNGGNPLGAGDYTLIAKSGTASVAGTAPASVTVDGDGISSGLIALLQITGQQLVLHVVAPMYRSRQSGNWNDFNTWQADTGGGFVNATSGQTPASAGNTIELQSAHTVAVTANVNADQVTVDSGGTLVVNTGITLTIDDGMGTDLTVNGTANVTGTGIIGGAGSFTLSSGATLGIGSTAGITSSGASGSIQVTGTRTFDTGANYTYNGSASQDTGNGLPATVNNLTINNSGAIDSNTVNLGGSKTVNGALTINDGILKQGGTDSLTVTGTTTINSGGTLSVPSGTSADFTGAAVTVNLGGGWEVYGGTPGNQVVITLSSTVSNAGLIHFDSGGTTCDVNNDFIQIRSSVALTQRTWSGAGTYTMQDVDVKDQIKSGTAIIASSSTDSGNNTNWTINTNCNAPTAVP